jgi:hypothetical protein
MPHKTIPAVFKITVRFPDAELYKWLLKEAKETEREPDQQIRYFLRFIKGVLVGFEEMAAPVAAQYNCDNVAIRNKRNDDSSRDCGSFMMDNGGGRSLDNEEIRARVSAALVGAIPKSAAGSGTSGED